MRKYVIGMLSILLAVVFTFPGNVYAEELNITKGNATQQADEDIVKIAYFNMGNYFSKASDGTIISYDTEILQKISEYSGLQFEYVDCGTWSNALTMLENHEVDLVGTAQWNQERAEKYAYCLESYGYTVGEFATLPETDIIYEDYETIGNSVIGCTTNYVRSDEMQAVFDEHQIHPVIKTYENQEDLENALLSGEIDIIAANSHTLLDDWNVVEKFSYSPYYFISWKGNESLTDMIDDTLIRINLHEPNYDDQLMNGYFPNMLGEPLTREEIDLIAAGKTYTVYYSADIKPLAWYDKDTDTMKGALIDACSQITENTGLKIEVRPDWEKPEDLGPTQIHYTTLFKNTNIDIINQSGVTEALITEPFNFYHKAGNQADINSGCYKIAFVGKRNLLQEYIQDKYPNSTLISCNSPSECLQMLRSNDVDLAYLSVHIAENELTEMGIDNIRELPIDEEFNGIGMIFEGENSELLKSIVNKGIQRIDQTKISNAMVQYALATHQKVTWRTMVEDYIGWVIFGLLLIVAVLLTIVGLFTYAKAMKKQRDRVEQADADRSEFFARMSHDMRTPMNGILGMIDLSKQSSDLMDIHSNMDKAKASGEYMLSLINDTLDLQKLETGKMKLQEDIVYTKDYFDGIFSMLKISAEKKHIEFRVTNINVGMEKYIKIDKIRVKQIFTNLLSNAIKFTPEGGTVEVIMECLGPEGDTSHKKFKIRDTGVGMSQDFIQNRIFKPYAQENSKITSELTGTGLGLAITKNLVDVMGGKLEVESELGEGTTFTFYLDFKNVPDEVAAEEEKKRKKKEVHVQTHLDGKRILLCEDHPLNAEIARRILQKAGCQVVWAENGQIGVDTFEKSEIGYFDVVLMDIRMPVMDGLSAAKAIRSLDRKDAGTVPIIAMTANAYDEDKKKSMEAGMNAHLAKPIEPNVVYETISNFLMM